jgi:beta-lactamase superfamily II metal-dependent hydrolase
MLKLEVLPAGHGDCLWIEYGDSASPKFVLIDGGAKGTYKRALKSKLAEHGREIELVVVTHVDGDHITGILDLLTDETSGFHAKDIWFNGYRHLPDESPTTLGPVQGEKLTGFLVKPQARWNAAVAGGVLAVSANGGLPRMELDGGLVLTLLSPTLGSLAALKPKWEKEVVKAGLDPGAARPEEAASEEFALLDATPPDVAALARSPFTEDDSEANGSSIALLLEFEQQRLLLAGDAHPQDLKVAIDRLRGPGKFALSACKLPHHGSKGNVSRQFLETLDCKKYIFSTNGSHFQHPDREAVARVIMFGGNDPVLAFNYRSAYTTIWDTKTLKEKYKYGTLFPKDDSEGIELVFG